MGVLVEVCRFEGSGNILLVEVENRVFLEDFCEWACIRIIEGCLHDCYYVHFAVGVFVLLVLIEFHSLVLSAALRTHLVLFFQALALRFLIPFLIPVYFAEQSNLLLLF